MGIFGRGKAAAGSASTPGSADLATLLLQGEEMIGRLAEAHMSWGLGTADHWGLDQRTGIITWTFPDKTATAAAQLIGSYNPSATSWLWAWANESVLPAMSQDSRTVRDWAEEHGQAGLARPKVEADDDVAASLSALAVRITRATGFYRGAGTASIPIITFGDVTLATNDGKVSSFKVAIE
ncbi:DUF6882 domain-containing protein [Dactylosporangium vinaceum]|uniref:DUF6882 domain-containing protein n=1 Tax=Dactylosporangium vinaceum TaxID=53362 RepID=A0ABV5MMJ3_9ACTN|nr:DUF6882 domain-containing protein [Dactylosporangium vinaceum]